MIKEAEVIRDETGCFWHPDLPSFDESESAKFDAWLAEHNLEISQVYLEDEDCDHPAYIKLFEEGDPDFREWKPPKPSGEGWFILAMADTEEGPTCCFARSKK